MMSAAQNAKEIAHRASRLSIEDSIAIDGTDRFTVGKKNKDSYILRDSTNRIRARWGNLEQITEDIEYVLQYQTLPPQEKFQGF